MKDHKDLWDMRDLPLPSRTDEKPSRQTIRSRSSLADWGEAHNQPADFWREWNGEASTPSRGDSHLDSRADANLPATTAAASVVESHVDDPELYMGAWAAQLALHERRLEREGTADYGLPFRKQEVLIEKTKDFAKQLQLAFRKHLESFNQARRDPAHAIHIYRISRSDDDFLIYRNGVKLIVSAQRAGRITLSFNQYLAPLAQAQSHAHVELEAIWGPFDQLLWVYKGERVQLIDIVQYFVSELAFQSFR